MPRGGNHLKTYPKDFKQSAIEMVLIGDRPMSHIAKELGINANTLYNWVGEHRRKHGITAPTPKETTPEEAKLKRLKKRECQAKNGVRHPKKATAYFAKATL
jgi:transposase-like protein